MLLVASGGCAAAEEGRQLRSPTPARFNGGAAGHTVRPKSLRSRGWTPWVDGLVAGGSRAESTEVPAACASCAMGARSKAISGVPEVLAQGKGAADVAVDPDFERNPVHFLSLRGQGERGANGTRWRAPASTAQSPDESE